MRFRHVLSAAVIGVLTFAPSIQAAEIEGEVIEVAGETIKITTASELLPVEGDAVRIYVEIEGIGRAEVGSGNIKGVKEGVIIAEIKKATGRIKKGQKATIDSPKPTRPADVKVPVVIGQAASDAKAAVAAAGFEAQFQMGMAPPAGVKPFTVYAQDPPGGSQLAKGGKVAITLYAGEPGAAPVEPNVPPAEPSAAPPKPGEPMESAIPDQELIQGVWICVKTTHDGKRVGNYVGVRIILDGDNLTWHFPRPDGTEKDEEARFRLQPAENPKHFDWFPKDDAFEVHKRLYVLEGDTLKMSANLGTKPRPATFAEGAWQFTCRRIRSAPGSAEPGATPSEGKPAKTSIGVIVVRVDSAIAKKAKLERAAGAIVEGVLPGGPAAEAGLLEDDVIVAVDGHSIELLKELGANIRSHAIGDEARISVLRDGQPMELTAKLAASPSKDEMLLRWREAADGGKAWAACRMGMAYEAGGLVEKDEAEAVKWYRQAAEQGYARAQVRLGAMYENGRGVSQDFAEAAKWYGEAALQEHAPGERSLGWLHQNGKGVAQNDVEAVRWFRKAAERGHDLSQVNLGWMYHNGRGVDQDYAEALKWYRQAADQGNAAAQSNIGVMYAEGLSVEKDEAEAVRWYRMAAEAGYANAQSNLGSMYHNGAGVTRDLAEALEWYRKAAERGETHACANLGLMYQRGEGVAQDYGEARQWFLKAVEQGNADAQNELGRMREFGWGVDIDYKEAMSWYHKAAGQKHAAGQFNVGALAYNGKGVKRNYTTALGWFRLAAKQNYPNAISALGVMHEHGHGVARDYAEAIRMYNKARELGSAMASYNLGLMYLNGHGVNRNTSTARDLLAEAAAAGIPEASQALRQLGESP